MNRMRVVLLIGAIFFCAGSLAAAESARPAVIPVWEGAELIQNVVYSTVGGRELRIDILRAVDRPSEPLPVVVWIHGGGWHQGRKEFGLGRMYGLPERGYLGALVEYRLTGEAAWPAQIHDCKCAIRFLRAHAEQYSIDPDRIGVWGASAGGHLAAMLGVSGGVPELEGEGGWPDHSSRVQAICDWYGPADLTQLAEVKARRGPDTPLAMLLGGPPEEKVDIARQASPITYVTTDDPPFLIMHGDQDRVVPLEQSQKLHDALTGAGVEVELVVMEGHGHAFPGLEANKQAYRFFDARLKDNPDTVEAEANSP